VFSICMIAARGFARVKRIMEASGEAKSNNSELAGERHSHGEKGQKSLENGKISAGILIKCYEKYLICHSTQKRNVTPEKYDGSWTISKGMVEKGELPIDAAWRELHEETNIDLNQFQNVINIPPKDKWKPITTYKTGKKNVIVFLLNDKEGKIMNSNIELKCTSLIDNVRTPHLIGLPEMDAFMWVTSEDARKMVFKTQQYMFTDNYLETKIKEAEKELEPFLK